MLLFMPLSKHLRIVSASLLLVGLSALVLQFLYMGVDSRPSPNAVCECDEDIVGEKHLDSQPMLTAGIAFSDDDAQFGSFDIHQILKFEHGRPFRFQSRGPPAMLLHRG